MAETAEQKSWIIPEKPALLFLEKEYGKTLVISDLHIGFMFNKRNKGIIIPNAQRPEEDLLQLVGEHQPSRTIILGDFKDNIFGAPLPLAKRLWEFLSRMLESTQVTIIKGNHDGKIEDFVQEEVEVTPATGLLLYEKDNDRSVGLWHGHATPALDVFNAEITISGHAHPAYTFRETVGTRITQKVWVKARWFSGEKSKERIHIIMPTYNKYIDGFSVDEEDFEQAIPFRTAIDFSNAEVFTLEGILLGTIGDLQEERKKLEITMKNQRRELQTIRRKRKQKK